MGSSVNPANPTKKIKTPRYKFKIVEWLDAAAGSSWEKVTDSDLLAVDQAYTAGWVVKETKEFITFAGTISGEQINNFISIPKAWIKRSKTINIDSIFKIP